MTPRSLAARAFLTEHPTATPFQPALPAEMAAVPAEEPPAPDLASEHFFEVDFGNSTDWVQIQITAVDESIGRDGSIQISFIPGPTCNFGDSHACVNIHPNAGQNLIFLTIHSGVGGEGQAFRHAIEGTGINRAGYSLERVNENLQGLTGAAVAIQQGGQKSEGYSLAGVSRIHPSHVQDYLNMPVEQAYQYALQLDPALADSIDPQRPVLVFETCGWRMPGESWYPGITATTGSIYVAVIQNLP